MRIAPFTRPTIVAAAQMLERRTLIFSVTRNAQADEGLPRSYFAVAPADYKVPRI